MSLVEQIFNQFQQRFFDSVTSNRLVYNSCWEDPRADRQLLQLNDSSKIVMLTSAGCNALDYLLDNPAAIHCVDCNPAQNALTELKIALFVNGDYNKLWHMFSGNQYSNANYLYRNHLREVLSTNARRFWDRNIGHFLPQGSASSFYFRGTSGAMAHIVHNHIRHKGLYGSILNLLDAKSLEEQRYYYEEIEPGLWNWFTRWVVNRKATMTMLGVPAGQRAMIKRENNGGLSEFIRESIRHVFLNRPVDDNYFWRVYLTGSYTKSCCPNYLKSENFDVIAKRASRINVNTNSLSEYLKDNPGNYSHFVLLDHQDWMADQHPKKLAKEWELILSNAHTGTRILFRSAGKSRSFVPDFVHKYVSFEDKKAQKWHDRDRVGTYGSTHLGVVKKAYA